MADDQYGKLPTPVGYFSAIAVQWIEFMRYLYLPVRMDDGALRLPPRLEFFRPLILSAEQDVEAVSRCRRYTYLTAHRGYATPDNPLNRPGWHCDGFGTDDLNYTWWDRWPTRVAHPALVGEAFRPVSLAHVESMREFEEQIRPEWIMDDTLMPSEVLYRFDPFVVHTTPVIPPPGGMRSFVKVSVSDHRYNLEGNSHNYLFDYEWEMHPRGEARNDPVYGEADYIPEAF